MSRGNHARVVEKRQREHSEDRRDLGAVILAATCGLAVLADLVAVWHVSGHSGSVTGLAGAGALAAGLGIATITARNPNSLLFDTKEQPARLYLPDEEE